MNGKDYKETTNSSRLRELLSEYPEHWDDESAIDEDAIDTILYFLPTEEARQKMIDYIETEKPDVKSISHKVPEFGNLRRVVPVES